MNGEKRGGEPLSKQQRRLVRENIGLVAVHLRRHVQNLSEPRRDREWEDLFQEGCLGLIRAATSYRKERGIPFAAFALPRIHNAVSRAIHSKFATVRVPPKRNRPDADSARTPDRSDRHDRVTVYSLSDELEHSIADERRHRPDGLSRETVGERLRGKYERAVRAAADTRSRNTSTRGDRDKLVRILLEERFMIPQEESRRALRQIARDTGSSYARVAQCDKQLGQATRIALDADPEFRELDRRARSAPAGTDLPIDRTLEHYLAGASAQEFVRRLRAAAPPERAAMILALLKLSDSGIFDAIHTRIARLPMQLRERLFAQVKTSQ